MVGCFIHISYAANLQRRGKWVKGTTRQRKQMVHKHEWGPKISQRLWRELTQALHLLGKQPTKPHHQPLIPIYYFSDWQKTKIGHFHIGEYRRNWTLYQVSAFALQKMCRGVNTRRVTAGRQHKLLCVSTVHQ